MSCLPFITSGPQVCKGVYGEKNLDTPQALLLSTLTFIGQYYRTVLQDTENKFYGVQFPNKRT